MKRGLLFGLGGPLLVAAVIWFAVVPRFVGWQFADALALTTAEVGGDAQVLAVEIVEGTAAFVIKKDATTVQVRHFSRHCVLRDGDKYRGGGVKTRGACQLKTRRDRVFERPMTPADRGPAVPLSALPGDIVDRLHDAGMWSYTDDAALWRGRWHFDVGITEPHTAAPDGSGVRKDADGSASAAANAVREMVGAPTLTEGD